MLFAAVENLKCNIFGTRKKIWKKNHVGKTKEFVMSSYIFLFIKILVRVVF